MAEPTLEGRMFMLEAGKVVLLLRLLAFFPVLIGLQHEHQLLRHLLVLVVLVGANGLFLLNWQRLAPAVERHPGLVGVDVVLCLLTMLGPSAPSPFLLYTLCSALLVGLLFEPVPALALTLLLAMAHVLEARVTAAPSPIPARELLVTLPLYGLMAASGGMFRRLHRQLAFSLVALHEVEQERQRRAAGDAERARLARELHDSVAKSLFGLVLDATALARSAPPGDPLADRARSIAAAARQTSRESRELLADLRGGGSAPGLAVAIPALVRAWSERVDVPVTVTLPARLDEPAPATRRGVLRCLEEALENAARHAQAGQVTVLVELVPAGRALTVSVTDDGRGFEPMAPELLAGSGHFGLIGLQERMAEISGSCRLTSRPGHGTTVELSVPLSPTGPAVEEAVLGRRFAGLSRVGG